MTRLTWEAQNRREEAIIFGSTSLKMRVELRVGDVAYESCDVDSVPQAKAWVRAKTIEWHLHSPRLVPEFIVV